MSAKKKSVKGRIRKTRTITFQPDDDVREMLFLEIEKIMAAGPAPPGARSKLINEAIRASLPEARVIVRKKENERFERLYKPRRRST